MPAKNPLGGKRVKAAALTSRKKRKASSQQWLMRQMNDPYVHAAKEKGFRARAAFKLIEIDQQYKLLRAGMVVVDLGAAPGSWCQVVSQKIGGKGKLVGIDLLPIDPMAQAIFLHGDFTDDATQEKLIELVDGKLDLVLSDMAPNTTGHAKTDHMRIMALAEMAFDWASHHLKTGGHFVCKLFQGGESGDFHKTLQKHFAKVNYAKPSASRAGSSEVYLVATGFKGI